MNTARNGYTFYEWRHYPADDWPYPVSYFFVGGIHYQLPGYEMVEFHYGKGLILRVVRIFD